MTFDMYLEVLLNFILLVASITPEPDFYDVSTNVSLQETAIDITDFTCEKEFCNKSLSRYSEITCFTCASCYCDADCIRYDDCCPDVLFNSEDTVIQQSGYISRQELYVKRSEYYENGSILVYTVCPDEFTDHDIKRKCENSSMYSIDEVTFVSVGNDTYRNKYCAVCHGQDSYTTWRRSVECQSGDILKSASDKTELWKLVLEDSRCKIKPIVPEDTALRTCESFDLIDKCNISSWRLPDLRSQQLCGMYYHPVKYKQIWYKNVFCAICNGAKLIRFPVCGETVPPTGIGYPLSVLIDFNFKRRPIASSPDVIDTFVEPDNRCNETSIFDPFSVSGQDGRCTLSAGNFKWIERPLENERSVKSLLINYMKNVLHEHVGGWQTFIRNSCRKALCSFGRIFSEGSCDVTFQSSSGLGYSGSVSLTYPKTLSLSTWRDIIKSYSEKLTASLEAYEPFIFPRIASGIVTRTETLHSPNGTNLSQETVVRASFDFTFVSIFSGKQLGLEEDFKKAHELEIKFVHGNENLNLTTQPIHCPDDPVHDLEKGESIDVMYSGQPKFRRCRKQCHISRMVFTPVFSIMECPFLEFNLLRFNHTLNPNNLSLEYDNQTFHLESHQYHICGEVLKICCSSLSSIEETLAQHLKLGIHSVNQSSTINPTLNRVSVSPALAIVSIFCIVLSLVCLFLTFSVYCLLPSLRTLPGKITMILVFYLFCAQLFFQAGNRANYDQKLCQAMGVLIHYLWVATFTSMGVSAFHMYTVFTKLSRSTFSSKTEDSKRVAFYLLVINLVSVVVVGICVTYHAGKSRAVDIGYGGDICFLVLPMDIGIFFGAPLGVILIFNTFCFFRVVLAIRNVTDMEVTKNKANRNHLNVYFRLSVILGFAWIFGFIAAATQFEPLWYVFVVLNGLQGMFVFVAYCVNSRTWGMIRDTYCCKQSDKPSDQISSPMPSTLTSNL